MTGRIVPLAPSRLCAGLALVATLLLLAPSRTPAQTCPGITPLTTGLSASVSSDPSVHSLAPFSTRWSVVAVRATDGEDWNLTAYDEPAAYPTCVSGILAGSASPSFDFLVTDWHTRPAGTDLIYAYTAGAVGTSALVEFEQAYTTIVSNQPYAQLSMPASNVVNVHETLMYAGISYQVHIAPSPDLTGLSVFVFGPAGGSGWRSRGDREAEFFPVASVENVFTFTPTSDGVHAIVVANEAGTSGDYLFTIRRCPFSSSPLADNTPLYVGLLDEWPAFTPSTHSWGAVGVRGQPGHSYNLEVAPWPPSQVGPFPQCTDSVLASQYSGLGTRVVAGDFGSIPLRNYTARVGLEGALRTSSSGYVEWDNGADTLTVDGAPLLVTPPSPNVVDAWSVRLATGASYDFQITPAGGSTANYQLLLFDHATFGSPAWSSRPEAVFATSSVGNFRPHASGVYGVVVVNDNGGTGNYSLSVTSSTVDVARGADIPGASRILSLAPNPAFEGARIAYELAAPGRTVLTVRDVNGRNVATIALGQRPVGPGSASWNGRDDRGRRVATGIYMLTLTVDGRPAGGRKLTVLD